MYMFVSLFLEIAESRWEIISEWVYGKVVAK